MEPFKGDIANFRIKYCYSGDPEFNSANLSNALILLKIVMFDAKHVMDLLSGIVLVVIQNKIDF
jgi:hypothetical protein